MIYYCKYQAIGHSIVWLVMTELVFLVFSLVNYRQYVAVTFTILSRHKLRQVDFMPV